MKSEEILSLCRWESRRELSTVGFGADMYLLPSLLSCTGGPRLGVFSFLPPPAEVEGRGKELLSLTLALARRLLSELAQLHHLGFPRSAQLAG